MPRTRPFFGLALLLFPLAACGALAEETADESGATSVEAKSVTALDATTFNGSIEVTAGAPGRVRVAWVKRGSGSTKAEAEADLKNVDVVAKAEGTVVKVIARRTDTRDTRSSGATLGIEAPPGAAVTLSSSNGALTVRGLRAAVAARTSNGTVRVEEAKGDARIETSNGAVEVFGDGVRLTAETSNGRVSFSGSLAEGESRLESSNGAIDVTLPPSAAFRLSAKTSNGTVTSDFPLVPAAAGGDRTSLDGAAGTDPRSTLVLETSNGSIRVRRGGG